MAEEIKLTWSDIFFEADISYIGGDLESEQGFTSAVIISLFTDARAEDDDVLPDTESKDKRGWWGDQASNDVENDQIGSKLWLLERSKTIPSVVSSAKDYVKSCLQWLVDDELATKIEAETERQGPIGNDVLAIAVKVYLVGGDVRSIAMMIGTNYLTINGQLLSIG